MWRTDGSTSCSAKSAVSPKMCHVQEPLLRVSSTFPLSLCTAVSLLIVLASKQYLCDGTAICQAKCLEDKVRDVIFAFYLIFCKCLPSRCPHFFCSLLWLVRLFLNCFFWLLVFSGGKKKPLKAPKKSKELDEVSLIVYRCFSSSVVCIPVFSSTYGWRSAYSICLDTSVSRHQATIILINSIRIFRFGFVVTGWLSIQGEGKREQEEGRGGAKAVAGKEEEVMQDDR